MSDRYRQRIRKRPIADHNQNPTSIDSDSFRVPVARAQKPAGLTRESFQRYREYLVTELTEQEKIELTDIGDRIRCIRLRHQWSRNDLAGRVNCHVEDIVAIENNLGNPQIARRIWHEVQQLS